MIWVPESGVLFNVNLNVDNNDSFWVLSKTDTRSKLVIDCVEESERVALTVTDDVFRRIPYSMLIAHLSYVRDDVRELITLSQSRCRMDGRDNSNSREKVTVLGRPDTKTCDSSFAQ